MSKIIVKLVKYDTLKTTKRKRVDLIVAEKTEQAVISKLERIHKGDKVKSIHEIEWSDKRTYQDGSITKGIVQFYDESKGFGFVRPNTDEKDLFFHSTALDGKKIARNNLVEFQMKQGKRGPIADNIKIVAPKRF
jgi:CspA family cold shock protein